MTITKSPLHKLGLRGHNRIVEFNMPLQFVKASISLGDDFKQEASTSKAKKPMIDPMKKMPPQDPKKKKPTQAPMKETMAKQRHAPKKGNKPHQHAIISHTSSTCHYCVKVECMQWRVGGDPLSKREKLDGFERCQNSRKV